MSLINMNLINKLNWKKQNTDLNETNMSSTIRENIYLEWT